MLDTDGMKAVDILLSTSSENSDPEEYDAEATVVSCLNGKAYVRIDGSENVTPATTQVNAKPGDRVSVHVSRSGVVIKGNTSSPVTDDTTANAARSIAFDAQDYAFEAAQNTAEAYRQAAEANILADAANTKAVQAQDRANNAYETANAAQGVAEQATKYAQNAIVSQVTYYRLASEQPTASEEEMDKWTSSKIPFTSSNAAYDLWVSVRVQTGSGGVTWSTPIKDADWTSDKNDWLTEFTDEQVWCVSDRGVVPDATVAWGSRPSAIVDAQSVWTATKRTYNSGSFDILRISPYTGAIAQDIFYWQELVSSDDTWDTSNNPTGYIPQSGWGQVPPSSTGKDTDSTASVWMSIRTTYGDGSFSWSDPNRNGYESSFINNTYLLQSIKSRSDEQGETISKIEQTSDYISSQLNDYVEKGTSGVSSLGTAIRQTSENITFGFTNTIDAQSSVTNMEFNSSGILLNISGETVASYGAKAVIGKSGKPRTEIEQTGVYLYGDSKNPDIPTATFIGDTMTAGNARVTKYLYVTDWALYERSNGNLTLKWVG